MIDMMCLVYLMVRVFDIGNSSVIVIVRMYCLVCCVIM